MSPLSIANFGSAVKRAPQSPEAYHSAVALPTQPQLRVVTEHDDDPHQHDEHIADVYKEWARLSELGYKLALAAGPGATPEHAPHQFAVMQFLGRHATDGGRMRLLLDAGAATGLVVLRRRNSPEGEAAAKELFGQQCAPAPAWIGNGYIHGLFRLPDKLRGKGGAGFREYQATNGECVGPLLDPRPGRTVHCELPPTDGCAWLTGRRLGDIVPPELPDAAVELLTDAYAKHAAPPTKDTVRECGTPTTAVPDAAVRAEDKASEVAEVARSLTPQEQIQAWLDSPFLKVDRDCWHECKAAAFTLAAMVHLSGNGRSGGGVFFGSPRKLAEFLGCDVELTTAHRRLLRNRGWLEKLPKHSRHSADKFSVRTKEGLRDARRWARVPVCALSAEGRPTARLMVLGALLSRGECVSTDGDQDWQHDRDGAIVPVVPSLTVLQKRCRVSRTIVSDTVNELERDGILVTCPDDCREPVGFDTKTVKFVWWPGTEERAANRRKRKPGTRRSGRSAKQQSSNGFSMDPEDWKKWRP